MSGWDEFYEIDWGSALNGLNSQLSGKDVPGSEKAQGIEKLQGQAQKRVALTVGAGDIPYFDSRIAEAINPDAPARHAAELVNIVCYLFSTGRLPRLEYIETEGRTRRKTREEVEQFVRDMSGAAAGSQEDRLDAFMREHVVFNEERGVYELDYARKDTWAYIEWKVG